MQSPRVLFCRFKETSLQGNNETFITQCKCKISNQHSPLPVGRMNTSGSYYNLVCIRLYQLYASGCLNPPSPSCSQCCSGFVVLRGELTRFQILLQIVDSDLATRCCLGAIDVQLWLCVRDSCHVEINLPSRSVGCSRFLCWIVLGLSALLLDSTFPALLECASLTDTHPVPPVAHL